MEENPFSESSDPTIESGRRGSQEPSHTVQAQYTTYAPRRRLRQQRMLEETNQKPSQTIPSFRRQSRTQGVEEKNQKP